MSEVDAQVDLPCFGVVDADLPCFGDHVYLDTQFLDPAQRNPAVSSHNAVHGVGPTRYPTKFVVLCAPLDLTKLCVCDDADEYATRFSHNAMVLLRVTVATRPGDRFMNQRVMITPT